MRLERQDDVAVLRMNDGRANAIGPPFLDGLDAAMDALGDARALVVVGVGSIFSAGLDLPRLIALDEREMQAFIARFSDVMLRLFALPLPVVAAVNGHAIAGGCVLALQADVRLCAERDGTKIGLNETALGIGLPSVVVETLRFRVPASSLVPLALEGRLVGPREAHALGLVDELVAPDALEARAVDRARARRHPRRRLRAGQVAPPRPRDRARARRGRRRRRPLDRHLALARRPGPPPRRRRPPPEIAALILLDKNSGRVRDPGSGIVPQPPVRVLVRGDDFSLDYNHCRRKSIDFALIGH
jgi:enoyl-CoA hydratase